MMNENERRNSPKNRWTRWYMWLAYGGGVLAVIAAVVVIVVMAPAPSSNGKTAVSHQKLATLTPDEVAALIRQHASINSPAEVNDLQFIANQDGITLDESIARYAWRNDFSKMVTAIEDEDPDSVVDAGSGKPDKLSAWINFSGSISGNARKAIDEFKSENPHVTVSLQTGKDPGFTKREAEEAVVGAHLAVMAEDGVQDSVTFYDRDAIEIVVTVQMATPPSGEKLSSLEKAAERGAVEATRPDITDSLAISLSVVQHDLLRQIPGRHRHENR